MTGPLTERSFAAGMSRSAEPAAAIGEAIGAVLEQLGHNQRLAAETASQPDVCVLFTSGRHCGSMSDMADAAMAVIQPTTLIAVTAVGVIGGGLEVENDDAVSLWAGHTGPTTVVRLEALDERPDSTILGLPDAIAPGSTMMLLADPFSFPVDALIDQLPAGVDLVGGLASAASAPGGNTLMINNRSFSDGAVGVIFPPGVANTVVSQGCRPVGSPWVVTAARQNLIDELGGKPAIERLRSMIEAFEPADRAAAARGVHIGLLANEQRHEFHQGDFLIRSVLGVEQQTQAVAIGDRVEVGQVVQFQVRDPASATSDLEQLMIPAHGALVFSCNGRGTHLFDEPDHDAQIVSEHVDGGVAGMFCAGELGPIGSRNALHGFTATVVAFREVP